MKKFLKNNDYKTYLGKRGYIIRKKFFNNDLLNNIRNELNVKPNVCTTYNDKIVRFKVYMENKNKMYIPKCYGIKKIGIPVISRTGDPHWANRYNQAEFIEENKIDFVFSSHPDSYIYKFYPKNPWSQLYN